MNIWTKLVSVPASNATKQIVAAQLWEVRWYSRQGPYHSDVRPEMEAFPSREAAEHFRDALVNAYRLIRHDYGVHEVTMSEVKLNGGISEVA